MLRQSVSPPIFLLLILLVFSFPIDTRAQTQTTGRIAGTVKDQNGAVIVGAEVSVINKATGDERKVTSDQEGYYSVSFLSPGTYRVKIAANGFNSAIFQSVQVLIT